MTGALFTLDQLPDTTPPPPSASAAASLEERRLQARLAKARSRVADVVGELVPGQTIHYASMGEWSSHDLLYHLLDVTGPAAVWVATWSITETPVRQLVDRLRAGAITDLHMLLDWRTRVRCPEAMQLAKANAATLRLANCHAKVTVVRNAAWAIAVVGSANYTNNPRIEAGVISTDPAAADFHQGWIAAEIARAAPFEE